MAATNTMAMERVIMTRRRRRKKKKKKRKKKKKKKRRSLSLSMSMSLSDSTEKSSSSLFLLYLQILVQKSRPLFQPSFTLSLLLVLVNAPVSRPDPSHFRPMPTDFSPTPITPHDDSTPPLTIILTIILLVFLFVGFFSIYLCRCLMDSILQSRNLRRTPSGNLVGPSSSSPAPTGLDPLLIKSFPTFPYSGIKDFRSDKLGLECAICLLEFEDDSFLRLLTLCSHVFHQECIDLWLESHKTCPVCRRNLDSDSPRNSADQPPPDGQISDHESIEDAISIEIDDDDNDNDNDDDDDEEDEDVGPPDPSGSSRGKRSGKTEESVKKFSRSHSTGHSIVKCRGEGDDRYTLRLPEHIKIKLIRGHNWTGSCVTFDEFSRNPSRAANGNGGGFLEVSASDTTNFQKPP